MKLSRVVFVFALLLSLGSGLAAAPQTPSAPLGIVGNANVAKIGNSPATEGVTVYSGDFLSTDNGGTLLVRIGPMSIELQSNSSAHIYRAAYGAVVELNSGTVNYSTPGGSQTIVIVASDIRVTPAQDRPDFGSVTIDDPCNVSVHSQRGEANVKVGSETKVVEEGKAYKVHAENSLTYRKYLSPDQSDYHNYHDHTPCAAAYQSAKGKPPIAGGQSRFLYVAIGSVGVITTVGVIKSLESPSRP
jgi:hypothetical protein